MRTEAGELAAALRAADRRLDQDAADRAAAVIVSEIAAGIRSGRSAALIARDGDGIEITVLSVEHAGGGGAVVARRRG